MEDQIDNEFLDENCENQDLQQCDICNRKFHSERIERHLIACQKAQQKQQERDKIIQKKKKQIEQKKQHLQQMDVEIVKTNWREEHQKFQEQIQYNRKLKQLEIEGQDVTQLKPLETKVNSNYVFCEYCERHFAKNVAERHIPKCKEIIAKPKPPRKKTVEMIQPSQPQLQEKRQAQVSTPSTSSQMERKPIIKKQLSDSSQQFRPTSLQKFIAEQSGKANLTNIGFIDCKARATAIQDTECPHCNRRFISRAAERHIPICEKLTRKHSFQIKYQSRKSVPIKQNNLMMINPTAVLPQIQRKGTKQLEAGNLPPIGNNQKFCTECGNRFQANHKYCGGCGRKREPEIVI
ncbi:unnamed protein product [Paramecium pentaurelia]|uniref:C2HC/C3H-type domain-containing protein n=1 Tax=Paramecium pentaurelia TaxID=43138 RepID=A0A8S1RWX5_9CILI|nr:unnamed protein product [Paramecium pentaurelia]